MALKWRYVTGSGLGAAEGLAGDEWLMGNFRRGGDERFDAALRLYTYRNHCAIVGRFQDLRRELNLDFCRVMGIDVGRRPTGGGAILMGEDQLGVALVTGEGSDFNFAGRKKGFEVFSKGIIRGLALLGIDAVLSGRNDLSCDGRKIAGLGLYEDDDSNLLFHSSVLAGMDMDMMLKVLKISPEKLEGKETQRIWDRLTTASSETGCYVNVEELREAVKEGYSKEFGAVMSEIPFSETEEREIERLAETRYRSDSWLEMEASGNPGTKTAVTRRLGSGTASASVLISEDIIKEIKITGDFIDAAFDLKKLEAALAGTKVDLSEIERVAEEVLKQDSREIGMLIYEACLIAKDKEKNKLPHGCFVDLSFLNDTRGEITF